MKVSEYVKGGLKNFTEDEVLGRSGSHAEGVHRVTIYVREEEGRVVDCKFNATKRCKKLLAVTDYACERLKETGMLPTEEEILSFFSEEKEKDKMKNRISIALSAIKKALS